MPKIIRSNASREDLKTPEAIILLGSTLGRTAALPREKFVGVLTGNSVTDRQYRTALALCCSVSFHVARI